ncbi:uncharacterized protein LOC142226724 isoform X4 [Haematobia irritans]|uniref:uncharacterized protein LOC142226724 isoform X4 n=1 Tax=Haematobia irritans TaxID=7368 RepID=UPI003F4F8639
MSAKMNNFSSTAATTTETLPKTGHVNEVCKEWLVREDGALAYKLQSQEITDFYKGNRTRNAVVREDFPTALQEQLKEKETAEKQAEAYRRRLKEQEEYDKRVAKEITEKLERDLQEQRLRELESEKLALDMEAIYVNLPPVPPPSARDKNKKLSPEKYDSLVGNSSSSPQTSAGGATKERHLQDHADDIELYVDPCDYKEIGLPISEIKEMNAKLKQEQKDALLARRLQEMEVQDGMTLEERDRMLAIEAQDKELAKMLQERMDFTNWHILRPGVVTSRQDCNISRVFSCLHLKDITGMLPRVKTNRIWEKAKAKRAKEKARQRKSQQAKEPTMSHSQQIPLVNGHLSNISHENNMPNIVSARNGHLDHHHQQQQHQIQYQVDQEDPLDLEAYSSPIDVLKHNQQRTQNGCLTNGSLQRDIVSQQARHASLAREDDIYTLPVDSCRPGGNANNTATNNSSTNLRPASMNVCGESLQVNGCGGGGLGPYSQNSMTRSENFSIHSHDSMNSRHSSNSKNQAFGIYIKTLAPHLLTCRFKVREDQIQVKIVKRNPRIINVPISKPAE